MDQDYKVVHFAFHEYLIIKEENEQLLDQSRQLFQKFQNYQDQQKKSLIEAKLAVMINQIHLALVESFYENLATDYKVFKFLNHFPSFKVFNYLIDGKIFQLPCPAIGKLQSQDLQDYLLKIFNFNYRRVRLIEFLLLWFPILLNDTLFYFIIYLIQRLNQCKMKNIIQPSWEQLILYEINYIWIEIGYDFVDEQTKYLDLLCKLLIIKQRVSFSLIEFI